MQTVLLAASKRAPSQSETLKDGQMNPALDLVQCKARRVIRDAEQEARSKV